MLNRKSRKLMCLFLAMALLVTALSGCAAADLGFIKLYKEIASLKSFALSGEIELEYDEYAMYSWGGQSEPVKLKLEVSGEAVYTDVSDMYFDLDIKYGIGGKDMPNTFNVKCYNNVMYIPLKDYVDISLEGYITEGLSDKMKNDIKREVMKAVSEHDYVIIQDMAEQYLSMVYYGYSDDILDYQDEVLDAIIKYITSMFSGFESGMIKAQPNGFAIEITPAKAVDFIDRIYKHVFSNKARFYKETETLYGELSEYMDLYDPFPDREDFDDALGWVEEIFRESFGEWDKEFYALLFKGSSIKMGLTKNGNKYTQNFDAKVNYRGKNILTLKGSLSQTAMNDIKQETVDTQNPTDMYDIDEVIYKVYKKINYVKQAHFWWYKSSYRDPDDPFDWTSVDLTRVEGSDWDYIDFVNEAGTIFVPMRQICEWFDEEVVWERAEKKAYVIKGGESIEMTGKIIEGRTFVKIRDFEKLGYTVNYEYDPEWGDHSVTVKKN